MIKVAVLGSRGRMGSEVVKAVTEAKDLELVAELDLRRLSRHSGNCWCSSSC
jgi:dihydrodipicolinate reductase